MAEVAPFGQFPDKPSGEIEQIKKSTAEQSEEHGKIELVLDEVSKKEQQDSERKRKRFGGGWQRSLNSESKSVRSQNKYRTRIVLENDLAVDERELMKDATKFGQLITKKSEETQHEVKAHKRETEEESNAAIKNILIDSSQAVSETNQHKINERTIRTSRGLCMVRKQTAKEETEHKLDTSTKSKPADKEATKANTEESSIVSSKNESSKAKQVAASHDNVPTSTSKNSQLGAKETTTSTAQVSKHATKNPKDGLIATGKGSITSFNRGINKNSSFESLATNEKLLEAVLLGKDASMSKSRKGHTDKQWRSEVDSVPGIPSCFRNGVLISTNIFSPEPDNSELLSSEDYTRSCDRLVKLEPYETDQIMQGERDRSVTDPILSNKVLVEVIIGEQSWDNDSVVTMYTCDTESVSVNDLNKNDVDGQPRVLESLYRKSVLLMCDIMDPIVDPCGDASETSESGSKL